MEPNVELSDARFRRRQSAPLAPYHRLPPFAHRRFDPRSVAQLLDRHPISRNREARSDEMDHRRVACDSDYSDTYGTKNGRPEN
jgi:hypothetical protein